MGVELVGGNVYFYTPPVFITGSFKTRLNDFRINTLKKRYP